MRQPPIASTLNLRIFVTAACNRNCRSCSQELWRKHHKNYHLSNDDLERLIQSCLENNYRFNRVILTGGEPTLWKNFDSVKLLHKAGIAKAIQVHTNVKSITAAQRLIDNKTYLDLVRVSSYPDSKAITDQLKAGIGKRLYLVDKTEFWELPKTIQPSAVPGVCCCDGPAYAGGTRIWYCGGCWSVARQFNLEPLSTEMSGDWLARIRKDYGAWEGCGGCVSNTKLRSTLSTSAHHDLLLQTGSKT